MYADNLQYDSELEGHFVRAECRINIRYADLTSEGGNLYSVALEYGPVVGLTIVPTAFTEASDPDAIADGEFYYDRDEKRLYFNYSFITPSDYIVATFRMFFSNQECIWHETPDDDTTPLVAWRPLVKTPPAYKVTIPAKGIGFFPIEPSSLTLVNDKSLNFLLGNGSMNRTKCELWHQLGELEVDNLEKQLTGVFGMRISGDDTSIIFDVLDKSMNMDSFPEDIRNYDGASTIDPRFQGTAVMKALGATGGRAREDLSGNVEAKQNDSCFVEMVNVQYDADAPTTSNNRNFALLYNPGGNKYTELTVVGRMNFNSNNTFDVNPGADTDNRKFRKGEVVWWDSDAGSGDDKYLITGDRDGSDRLAFTTNPGGSANQAGTLRRSIFDVFLIKDGTTPIRLKYGRDFTQATHLTNVLGITLTSTAEANNSVATFDPKTDAIWCVPLGRTNQVTYDGNNVGGATNMKTGGEILYQFLKEEAGLDESEIDYQSIEDAAPYIDNIQVFVPLPLVQLDDYPTIRTVLDLILKTLLVRGYFNAAGQFTIRPIKPIVTVDEDVAKEHLAKYSFEIDYSDIKALYPIAVWNSRTRHFLGFSGATKDQIWAGTAQVKFLEEDTAAQVSTRATITNKGSTLHQATIKEQFEHLCGNPSEQSDTPSTPFQPRLWDIFSERSCSFKVAGKRLALQRTPGDTLAVGRDSIVGQDDAVGNTTNTVIMDIDKSSELTDLTLDDNKAANDAADEDHWQEV